jgi:hypothetical protein
MRIPIHYESFLISNGLRSGRATVGRLTHHTAYRDAEDAEISSYDHHIAGQTNIDDGDVCTFRSVCIDWRVLIVVRCPGIATRRAASLGIGVSGKPEEDKEGLKLGDDLVRRGNGQLIVSDYDLMSVWTHDGGGYQRLEFTRDGPGHHSRWTNPDAERLFLRLNDSLHIQLEHGANDDWKTDNEIYRGIREAGVIGHRTYVAFTESGGYQVLPSPAALKNFYLTVLRAPWPYST